jgi:hypothetical protein
MSDPRYAPPAEEAETQITPVNRETMKWQRIYTFTAIPINTLPATLPIIAIFSLATNGFERITTPVAILIIIIGLTLVASWIYAGCRLSKLRREQLQHHGDRETPQ